MLVELIQYLLTPCPGPARKLGYLKESVAIVARHGRHRQAWAAHLARCRGLIMEAAQLCPKHQRVLILGSGALLDIPLPALASTFQEVILADVVHPLSALRQTKDMTNVRLIHADLTGVLPAILGHKHQLIPELPPQKLFAELTPDLVVSANLLSQLPLLPCKRLLRSGQRPEIVEAFAVALLHQHLKWLRSFPAVVCLITDLAQRVGEQCLDLLHGLGPEVTGQTWDWLMAPKGELLPDKDVIHLVSGLIWADQARR